MIVKIKKNILMAFIITRGTENFFVVSIKRVTFNLFEEKKVTKLC